MARVSRGRTIREFVIGVLIIPPLISFTWIAGFGGTALKVALTQNTGIEKIVDKDYSVALFELLQQFPISDITSILAIALIFIFIVTSADSTTHIVASMATGGVDNPKVRHKVIWGLLIGAISVTMTIAGSYQPANRFARDRSAILHHSSAYDLLHHARPASRTHRALPNELY